jgi:hypothetical protein
MSQTHNRIILLTGPISSGNSPFGSERQIETTLVSLDGTADSLLQLLYDLARYYNSILDWSESNGFSR